MSTFEQRISELSDKVQTIKESVSTEAATKSSLVMPFLQLLGYDVFNPTEVVPEFDADVTGKKGEKVDYCIFNNGEPSIIIECKHWKENLNLHNTQLERYFAFTNARFGILTNGIQYRFYTDLDKPNKMDIKPFFELDLSATKENNVQELKKFHKQDFDAENIFGSASELRYIKEVKVLFEEYLREPSDEFVKVFATKVYDGQLRSKIIDQFKIIVRRATNQFINETITDRLHKALHKENDQRILEEPESDPSRIVLFQDDEKGIVTTQEEVNGFEIVREILTGKVDLGQIHYRDAKTYFSILFEDNNRKPICRLKLDGSRKYIIVFDDDGKEQKFQIEKIEHIYMYANQIVNTTSKYFKDKD